MHTRLANKEDIPSIVRLGKYLLEFHGEFDFPYYELENNFDTEFSYWVSAHINHPYQFIFIAEDDKGTIVGFIAGFLKSLYPWFKLKQVGHIAYLAVDKKYQKSGIGSLLESSAQKWFIDKNVPIVEVYTDELNLIGKKAWSKYGYKDFKKFLRKKLK